MSDTTDRIIDRLEIALHNAEAVAQSNREQGSPIQSTAYDSGRIAGLKEALELVWDVSKSA